MLKLIKAEMSENNVNNPQKNWKVKAKIRVKPILAAIFEMFFDNYLIEHPTSKLVLPVHPWLIEKIIKYHIKYVT